MARGGLQALRGLPPLSALAFVSLFLALGCGDDDAATRLDGGMDAGSPDDDGGQDAGGEDASPEDAGDGRDAGSAPDASDLCGNGTVDDGEACDDGNDSNDDDCRTDCQLTCGDGELGGDELCDVGIEEGMPGSCPSSCDDGEACTADVLLGTGCRARCEAPAIEACMAGDGCCPAGCTGLSDLDCPAVCDNGVIEPGETCEPAASCVTACDDGEACTSDTLAGDPAACTSECRFDIITACVADGCCAAGCSSDDDPDCSATCDNGTVEAPETCDPIASCPAACDDGDACTVDTLVGAAATCSARCTTVPVATCTPGDGCCPSGCNQVVDDDCLPVCGNRIVEQGETCDDGNLAAGDGCDGVCRLEATPTAFRLTSIEFRDPHAFASALGCADVTGLFNGQIRDGLTMDMNGDGFFDLGFALVFRPLSQTAGTETALELHDAVCDTAVATTCRRSSGTPPATARVASSGASATCLAADPAVVRPYSPGVEPTGGPCFVSEPTRLTITFAGVTLALREARISGTYLGVPARSLESGLLIGFLTEGDADATVLPMTLPVVGGMPLATLFAGGTGACSTTSDMDTHPVHGAGWWVHLALTARRADWASP